MADDNLMPGVDYGDTLQTYDDYINSITNTDGSLNWDTSLGGSGIFDSILSGGSSLLKYLGGSGGAQLATAAGGILGLINPSWASTQQKPVGYTGGIPQYQAVREAVPGTYDPNRRPGSRGQEYMTNVQFAKPDQVATAQAQAAQDAQAAEARNKTRQAEFKAAPPRQDYAAGGIANLAGGNYLAGGTDGMADKIPATIAGKQPAKLSHGEFVVPADCVSALGGGNSDAGAKRLYDMMDRIRTTAHGKKSQMKPVDPKKVLPA